MIPGWLLRREAVEVPCTIDIENSADSLHAYVELEGIEVGPGDEVQVLDAPTEVPAYGDRVVCRRRASVVRAGPLGRLRTYLASRLELTDLYEVGFHPERETGFQSWRSP